jgi:hypothetical protein
VGVSFGAGAIAGLVGFAVDGGIISLAGTGFLANIGAGAISGAFAGQYGRLAVLVLSGQTSRIHSVLLRPQDILVDFTLGGVGGVVGYGIQRLLSKIGGAILQGVTNRANSQLAANPGLAKTVLSDPEYVAGQTYPSVARMEYGNAVEKMVNNQIRENPILSSLFKHTSGPNNPDFVGTGIFAGMNFDITTNTSRSIITTHLSRAHGQGLIMATYSCPFGFGIFQ